MNKRILVILAVFVAGFAVGYGLTWVVISGPGPQRADVADRAPRPAVPAVPAVPSGTVEAAPDALAGGDIATAAEVNVAPSATAPSPVPVATGAEPEDEDPGDTSVAPSPAPRSAPSAPVDAAPASARHEPQNWWDACLGKRCRVDFGRVTGGISMRAGHLEHGAEIVWRERFADAKRIGMLPARDDIIVELHGVGMTHGLPSVAFLTWLQPDHEPLTGIMSLNIGEKVVKLVPLDGQ